MFNHGIYLGKKEMQQRKLDGNQYISCQNDVKTYACGLPKQANWKGRRWWWDSRIFELRIVSGNDKVQGVTMGQSSWIGMKLLIIKADDC